MYQAVIDEINSILAVIENDNFKLKDMKDKLKFINDKLLSNSYKSGFASVKDKLGVTHPYENLQVQKLKDTMDVQEVKRKLEELLHFLKQPICEETFVMKSALYNYINRFWDGKCFLLRANAAKNMREVFETDFAVPLREYIKKSHDKEKDICIDCGNLISGKEKVSIAFMKDMADDLSRKRSAFWNCKVDAFLCPICAYIYALAPLGFLIIGRRYVFVNVGSDIDNLLAANNKYSHDDIGWGLDYDWLAQFGIDEVAHKKFLNDYFTGKGYNSDSRGELYNDDPRLGDARLCGTTASLSGLEAGQYEANADKIEQAIACDLMLHGYLLAQSGIPVLYSGDEIGQTNDYTYKNDPDKCADSRYLHRGNFPWDKVENKDPVAMKIFDALRHMEDIRASHDVFSCNANVYTIETGCASVLGIVREYAGHELRAFFNFSNMDQLIWTMPDDQADIYTDLISGKTLRELGAVMPRYGCWWFYR